MTAEREAMTLEQVRDWLQNCADSPTKSSDISNDWCGVMADAIDAHLSRAAEPAAWVSVDHSLPNNWFGFVWQDKAEAERRYASHLSTGDYQDPELIPLYTHPPEPARDAKLPKDAPLGLLVSMAIRFDHGLGVPGYYDASVFGVDGVGHAKRLRATISTMRQLYEEVSGHGFYSPAKEASYAAMTQEGE